MIYLKYRRYQGELLAESGQTPTTPPLAVNAKLDILTLHILATLESLKLNTQSSLYHLTLANEHVWACTHVYACACDGLVQFYGWRACSVRVNCKWCLYYMGKVHFTWTRKLTIVGKNANDRFMICYSQLFFRLDKTRWVKKKKPQQYWFSHLQVINRKKFWQMK